ncbi:uncharacterized protein LOC120430255 [Culex pipiens pallens]|uniref:uncharacterized protein LOC120430255 n=1 Tax=Culex pipiens pallens TaxID=42434 RepID=UPI0019535272|nr:uncharacterized protein LOC120430255 [Culex pipiens pallens]
MPSISSRIALCIVLLLANGVHGYRTTSLTKPASVESYKRMVQTIVRTLSTVQLIQIKMAIIGMAIVGSYLLWFKLFPNVVEVKLPNYKEAVYNQTATHKGLFDFLSFE